MTERDSEEPLSNVKPINYKHEKIGIVATLPVGIIAVVSVVIVSNILYDHNAVIKTIDGKYVVVQDVKDKKDRAIDLDIFSMTPDEKRDFLDYAKSGDTICVHYDRYNNKRVINKGKAYYNRDSIAVRKDRAFVQQLQKHR